MTAATIGSLRWHPRLRGLTWVTWRQHRAALAGTLALLGGTALVLLINGRAMHRAYAGIAMCGGTPCEVPYQLFTGKYQAWAQFLPRFLTFLPAVIGVFVGAPLVARELESGTYRFAWTQGRGRVRWIEAKLVLLGSTLTLLAVAFSWCFSWWFGPWHSIMGRMGSGQAYEIEGLVFAARTLFAFTSGVFLGAVIRRTVPAMAATAALWLAVAWPTTIYLRPLIQPAKVVSDAAYIGIDKAWTISSWVQDGSGHHLSDSQVTTLAGRARAAGVQSSDQFTSWLAQHHYTRWDSYQPDSRFWHFQAVEASCWVLAALLFAAATVWWLRRRAA